MGARTAAQPYPVRMGRKGERLLTVTEVAAAVGVDPRTISAYKTREQMPAPDKQYGRTPLWRESTIRKWRPDADLGPTPA